MEALQFDNHVVYIGLTFLLAGFVKGVVGMGLPTVAVGLLGVVMAPGHAAALLVAPSMVTNAVQIAGGARLGELVARLWPMFVGIVLGTVAVGMLAPPGEVRHASAALGAALILYAVVGLASWQMAVPAAAERWLGPSIGLVTGAITAVTGVFVIPAVPYLQGLGLARDDLVQALGLSFTVSTLALAVTLSMGGVLWHPAVLGASLAALVPALVGMWVGQRLRHRIPPARFRRVFFVGLLLLGADLAWRGLA
ncbi:sulfite exporter TauE/SafE family protein [Cupriavidus sp. AU9028]|uniref:sulfite exporter TauE/SafE family protein n=1 Tax=Cupriavidus sp. AU9028 TaxID=2871157 RepID=UPI001C980873|nr:sulfite exporter TauE/SafE family protein [Cupriavidus sp. AU9028]MBY4896820.1 sulfite exporter TauE/SafE family protein [Cupriavidus sp. AU9028]